MQSSPIPGLSELVFEPIPVPPPTLSALIPGNPNVPLEARLRKASESRVDAVNSLAARLHVHGQLQGIDELPDAVHRELTQTEASAWALMCYVNLILGANEAACDSGHKLLEQFSELPRQYQNFGNRLITALVVRVSNDALFDEIQQSIEKLQERYRDNVSRLIQVQRGIEKARNQELPAALSMLSSVTAHDSTKDLASVSALFSMARIYETEQLAWEEMQCCLRWRDTLQTSEKVGVAAYAGRLAASGVSETAVVDTGLRLVSLLRSADRHQEADALIGEFESAGYGTRASILKSQEPRAEGWSVHLVDDTLSECASRARATIYGVLVSGRCQHACVALKRGSYEEPVSREIDSEIDPIRQLVSDLPNKVASLGLEVVSQALMENALSPYQWILLREQERPLSGLLIGLLNIGSSVSPIAVRCIAFPTRIDEMRDGEWLREAVNLLMTDFDTAKRRGAMQVVDQVLQRLAPPGTRVKVTEV